MSPELIVPAFLVAAGILFLFFRRWSELPPPKPPEIEIQSTPPAEGSPETVLITHPMIRRAAERALADGSDTAKRYIRRNGDRVYFTFSGIKDPVARQKAVDIIRSIEEGGEVSIADALQLLRGLFSGK
jgi:hypothetical protein